MSRRTRITIGLLVAAAATYLAVTAWPLASGDRPTLMYFRADL